MIVVAQHRHARIESRHILEEHVVVLARLQRHGDTDAGREITRPHAGAKDDILRIDGALLVSTPATRRPSWRMRVTFTS